MRSGGADRDRTGDPLLAKQVLSQLSYSPNKRESAAEVVGLGRVELPTSPLSGVRSNQLSYRPVFERFPKPGGSQQPHSIRKVSRTRLNVLDGYAVHDHRAMADRAKKV